jgi:hypothetical protein
VRITTEQCDEVIDAIRRVRDDLGAVYAMDRQLKMLERPDGFRTSVRATGSPSSTDDEGEILPPHSDPTGSAVVLRVYGRSSPTRREIETMNGALNEILDLARQADGARSRALEPGKEHKAPDGCRNHLAHGLGWHPPLAKERCRWCYEFWSAEGVDAPKELLEKRDRGGRVNEADVDRALAHRRSKRARARRRRAG